MAIHELEMRPEPMTDAVKAITYMLSGGDTGATMTFKSTKTGNRYTYLIQELSEEKREAGKRGPFFVKTLVGPDNEADFKYMGMISFWNGKWAFKLTAASAKANLTEQNPKVIGFRFTFEALITGKMPFGVLVFPSIRCARCNRKLTDTDQPGYAEGFGPDCFEIIGGEAGVAAFSRSYVITTPVESPFVFGSNTVRKPEPVKPFSAPRPDPAKPAYIKPVTPRAIVQAVNEDAEISKMAAELWAKNEHNPANIAPKPVAEPLPVDMAVAAALAKSQDGWTVEDAVEALKKRRIVNMNLKSTKVAEKTEALVGVQPVAKFVVGEGMEPVLEETVAREYEEPTSGLFNDWEVQENGVTVYPEPKLFVVSDNDPEIVAKVNDLKNSDPGTFTSEGIMDEEEAFSFWYRRFAANSSPVER